MHLYVTGRHFELTESIHSHVQRKLVHPIETHTNPHDVQRVEIQLYKLSDGGVRFGCHVLVQMPEHHDINIREEDIDLYEAIDVAEKRLVRKLVEDRERRLTTKRRPRKYSVERIQRTLRAK